MTDKIEKYGNSLLQHGKVNDRIYLMKLAASDLPDLADYIENLAAAQQYSKIFAKIPERLLLFFLARQYSLEVRVEKFFKGSESCCFVAKYFDEARQQVPNKDEILKTVAFCQEKAQLAKVEELDQAYRIKKLDITQAMAMAKIYQRVFASYPFAIFEADYIKQTMQENIAYYGVCKQERIIALASAEIDWGNSNAEMTDFATLPEFRGQNLAYHLLVAMENAVKKQGIKTTYTIARSNTIGINMIFAKNAYTFAGILANNTHIGGNIESMNVWFKSLA